MLTNTMLREVKQIRVNPFTHQQVEGRRLQVTNLNLSLLTPATSTYTPTHPLQHFTLLKHGNSLYPQCISRHATYHVPVSVILSYLSFRSTYCVVESKAVKFIYHLIVYCVSTCTLNLSSMSNPITIAILVSNMKRGQRLATESPDTK